MATGWANRTSCQPDADSLVKAALASFWPLAVHNEPTWVPALWVPLKNRTPWTLPALVALNRRPSSNVVDSVAPKTGASLTFHNV